MTPGRFGAVAKGGVESGTRDLYEVMEVTPTASEAEIRAAFRRLAVKYHPDRNTDPNAAIHFKRINAAFQVLSDPQRREAYDSLTGQVEPVPVPRERTDPMRTAPTIEGWYVSRNGATEGPVPPQVVVSWIHAGLRDAMVRFGSAGQWQHLTQSLFAKFIPQTMPPPAMGSDPAISSIAPPRLRFVSDADVGRKKGGVAGKIIIFLLVAGLIGGAVWFFGLPYLAKRKK